MRTLLAITAADGGRLTSCRHAPGTHLKEKGRNWLFFATEITRTRPGLQLPADVAAKFSKRKPADRSSKVDLRLRYTGHKEVVRSEVTDHVKELLVVVLVEQDVVVELTRFHNAP